MVEDFDSRDLDTDSDREATVLAAQQLYAEQWPASLRDELVIDSQEVTLLPERRYALNLASDSEDLDVEEVGE